MSATTPGGPRRGIRGTLLVLFITTAPRRMMEFVRRRMKTPIEELIVTGRRTGTTRSMLVTLADVDGRWYVGHPDGATTNWVENLKADPAATVVRMSGERTAVRAVPLDVGPERSAAVAALIGVQRGPARLFYGLARQHIEAHAQVFRLERTVDGPA